MPILYRMSCLGKIKVFGNTTEPFLYCEVATVSLVSGERFHLLHFKDVKLTITTKNFFYTTKKSLSPLDYIMFRPSGNVFFQSIAVHLATTSLCNTEVTNGRIYI